MQINISDIKLNNPIQYWQVKDQFGYTVFKSDMVTDCYNYIADHNLKYASITAVCLNELSKLAY